MNSAQENSSVAIGDKEQIEFRESALLVNSVVTLFGELHRDTIGRLHLQAWHPTESTAPLAPRDSWRTSWECQVPEVAADGSSQEDVLASDDPLLLTSSARCHL